TAFFFYQSHAHHPALHSFPTRRSSDLLQPMLGRDVIVAHREQRERPVGLELGMTMHDGRPGRLHGAIVREVDLEPLAPGGLAVPSEETNSNTHSGVTRSLEAVGLAAAAAGLHVGI